MAASIRKMSTLAKNSHVLSRLRESMASAVEGGLAAYIVPSGDPHNVRRWCVACVWRSLACLHRHTHAHTSVGIGVLCSAERVRGGARHEAHLPDRVLGVGWHRWDCAALACCWNALRVLLISACCAPTAQPP